MGSPLRAWDAVHNRGDVTRRDSGGGAVKAGERFLRRDKTGGFCSRGFFDGASQMHLTYRTEYLLHGYAGPGRTGPSGLPASGPFGRLYSPHRRFTRLGRSAALAANIHARPCLLKRPLYHVHPSCPPVTFGRTIAGPSSSPPLKPPVQPERLSGFAGISRSVLPSTNTCIHDVDIGCAHG